MGAKGVALVVALPYCGVLLALVTFQRSLIFPRPSHKAVVGAGGLVQLAGTTDASPSVALHVKPAVSTAPTVVYFHGNADQIGWGGAHVAAALRESTGFGLYAIEYPGYGYAGGSPTEEGMYAAAEELLIHLTTAKSQGGLGVARSRVVLLGQSIGGAVATEMACRGWGERGLVLLSAFSSLQDMVDSAFPIVTPVLTVVPWVLLDKFDNLGKAQAGLVQVPVLCAHGTDDEIVPFSQGVALVKAFGERAELLALPRAGHNDVLGSPHWEKFVAKLVAFTQTTAGAAGTAGAPAKGQREVGG